jgi:hypothetical protein
MMKQFILLVFMVTSYQLALSQEPTDSIQPDKDFYQKFRLGSYGEMLYQRMDYSADRYTNPTGAPYENRSLISIPRMILAIDYKFTPSIIFSTEIEFENGGTGSAMELEYDEMGEYEMEVEKGGEVVLEQFHITKEFSKAFKLRVGQIIVPVGTTNARHLPIEFFGTIRPEGENTILPLTWHETGVSVLGEWRKWNYEFQMVNGLDANGFSSHNWIKNGKQGIFETNKMTNPAYTGRIENTSVRNLRLGISGYIGNSAGNTAKPEKMENIKGTVSIVSAETEYNNQKLILRGNVVYGKLSDSYQITTINKNISKNIQYPRTPVASNAMEWSVEAGYDILSLFHKREKLYPFARYEYYNSMEKTEGGILADERFKCNVLTMGINYYVLPNLALKADYSSRTIANGKYNTENTVSLAVVYTAWFFKR